MGTYDARMRVMRRAPVSPDIVFVEINDLSIRDLAPMAGRWPWPRVVLAELIDFLSRGRAKVIAVDIAMPEADIRPFTFGTQTWTGEQSDDELAKSVKKAGNVIMLADAVNPGAESVQANAASSWRAPAYPMDATVESRPLILPPYQSLADAAAGFGHNFLPLDADGRARRMPPFVRERDRVVASLGIAAAIAAGRIRAEELKIPLVPTTLTDHTQWSMLIDYRAPALVDGKPAYPTYEARHLIVSEDAMLAGNAPLVDPAVFNDKIVFVGVTAAGLHDVFQTPYGDDPASGTMPGIQLHASMAESVLANRFIRPADPRLNATVAIVASLVVALLAVTLPYTAGALTSAAAMAAWTAVAFALFRGGTWTGVAEPVAAMALALFAGTAYRYFVEDRDKREVKRLFGRFVSKDVVEQIVANPSLAALGGKRREMSVLFSDIRGFTTVTESGQPEALVEQLNEYFTRMVGVVFGHAGTVDKFVGDMVMALYGAPLDDPEHAEHAVATAVGMVKELRELNREWAKQGKPALDIGIGVNSGEMVAGHIGSSAIMSYTVIGDNVNLASRLESLNKQYGTRIIISDATRSRLTGSYDIHPLGDVVVKGKTRPVAIFEVRVPAPVAEPGQVI
jgi:adenylate cyclase